jgi:DNA-binding CsgD family transcriptional regulator
MDAIASAHQEHLPSADDEERAMTDEASRAAEVLWLHAQALVDDHRNVVADIIELWQRVGALMSDGSESGHPERRGRARTAGHAQPLRQRLTVRETEVLQLLAEANTSKEVARELGVSVNTVEAHRANIMRKLDLHSVAELVLYAVRNRIITP